MNYEDTEREDWVACGLEDYFTVLDPSEPGCNGRWGVMDAECVLVATCDYIEHARIVARALNLYTSDAERRLHGVAERHSEE